MVPIRATYRFQLHVGFPLARARDLVPYLSRLGVSHIHCSPLLQARAGSSHGYDVTDPSRLNPELGSEQDLADLVADLQARGMGLILDIVPNHMAASSENPAWEDVLMHGPASRYARWFDVDWRAPERELRYRVLLPVLGDHRSRVLQAGEIALAVEDGRVRVRYYEHGFPLDPSTLPAVLVRAPDLLEGRPASGGESAQALRDVLVRLRRMPRRSNRRPGAVARRQEIAGAELDRLRQLCVSVPEVAEAVTSAATEFQEGEPGRERLRRLLDGQVYRLVHWKRAARELNYRRFFDVNDLVALHMEDPEVFAETHGLVLEWRRRGWIDGFRIDHPDGLLDPLEYFRRLAAAAFPETPGHLTPIYAEKILTPGESLRKAWPVSGTTGYDFLNQAESVYLEPEGVAAIEQEYRRIIRQPLEFPSIARLAKRRVLESGLSAGVRRLAERLLKLAGPTRPLPTITPQALSVAIVETIASLPVYRTYVDPAGPVPEGEDRRLLEEALRDARGRGRASAEALDLLSAALLGTAGPLREPEVEGLRLRFVQRFQQLSGPAMAKGIEDTAFYSFAPLLPRNEVGGGPEIPLASALNDFHLACRARVNEWPRAMLAATTHDTKRTADVRSRLDVLSEMPGEWKEAVERWRGWNQGYKRTVGDRRDPDPNTVYHVLQALLGLWPTGLLAEGSSDLPDEACLATLRERLTSYAIKAAREAKLRTSWTEPDSEFEDALTRYVAAILDPSRSARFLEDFGRFAARVTYSGLWNALSRVLLHLTAPGVPDLYQGDELWNLALVDPDNRRAVDYNRRQELLSHIERVLSSEGEEKLRGLAELASSPEDGRLKLYVVVAVLQMRSRYPDLFLSGGYEPLLTDGPNARHVVAYGRSHRQERILVLAPRLLVGVLGDSRKAPDSLKFWRDTEVQLPPGWPECWRSALTSERLSVQQGRLFAADAFRRVPLALLVSEGTQPLSRSP
jgi:(1->4)-alpha-D-glucan 1-alpha-D-glucosylmutase